MAAGLIFAIAYLVETPLVVGLQAEAVFAALVVAILALRSRFDCGIRLGPADRVTLVRVAVAAFCAGLLFHGDAAAAMGWWLPVLAGGALVLDGVDGWVARRMNVASAFGSRFDMETDAFFILMLSGLVWQLDKVGAWVLAIGAMRYLFVATAAMVPALTAPLYPSRRRQAICVLQVAALILCLTPVVGPGVSAVVAAVALAALVYSFAVDTIWLLRTAAEQA